MPPATVVAPALGPAVGDDAVGAARWGVASPTAVALPRAACRPQQDAVDVRVRARCQRTQNNCIVSDMIA